MIPEMQIAKKNKKVNPVRTHTKWQLHNKASVMIFVILHIDTCCIFCTLLNKHWYLK